MSLFDENVSNLAPSDEMSGRIWQQCLDELKYEVPEKEFIGWLTPLTPKMEQGDLVLYAINAYYIKHINEKYIGRIGELVQKYAGDGVVVRLEVIKAATEHKPKETKATKNQKSTKQIEESEQLNERFTFDAFVKGKSNSLAYNTCYELAKKAGQSDYQLMFIYGSSGLGKTHLMQAVAHRYQKAGLSFCYFTKDRFFYVTKEAFRTSKADALVKKICKADLLIVDDVHFINNRSAPKLSELLLTIFSEFSKDPKKRIILASDRQPSQMVDFDERFRSRFSGGLSLPIEPPDIETRVQILEKKALSHYQMTLPKDCAIFIAQNVALDVRRLEGALNQVHALYKSMDGEPITLSMVRQAIKDRVEARAKAVNAENIKEVVAEYYSVSAKDLMGKKRARNVVRPRQMAMALIRELTHDSFPEIGQAFGGRDHTTVMHACKAIEELCQTDPKFDKDYQALKATLEFV